jgi:hypothetical protein
MKNELTSEMFNMQTYLVLGLELSELTVKTLCLMTPGLLFSFPSHNLTKVFIDYFEKSDAFALLRSCGTPTYPLIEYIRYPGDVISIFRRPQIVLVICKLGKSSPKYLAFVFGNPDLLWACEMLQIPHGLPFHYLRVMNRPEITIIPPSKCLSEIIACIQYTSHPLNSTRISTFRICKWFIPPTSILLLGIYIMIHHS